MSLDQAKARYLALIKPTNVKVGEFRRALDSGNLRAVRMTSQALDATQRALTAGLLSTRWPDSVAPTAQKLAEAAAAELVLIRDFETVKTTAQLNAASEAFDSGGVTQNLGTQVELMRTLLGLPKAS